MSATHINLFNFPKLRLVSLLQLGEYNMRLTSLGGKLTYHVLPTRLRRTCAVCQCTKIQRKVYLTNRRKPPQGWCSSEAQPPKFHLELDSEGQVDIGARREAGVEARESAEEASDTRPKPPRRTRGRIWPHACKATLPHSSITFWLLCHPCSLHSMVRAVFNVTLLPRRCTWYFQNLGSSCAQLADDDAMHQRCSTNRQRDEFPVSAR